MNPRPPLLLGIHVLQMSETTRDNPSYCRSSCTRKNVADCSTGMYDKLKTYKLWVQVVIISCIILALLYNTPNMNRQKRMSTNDWDFVHGRVQLRTYTRHTHNFAVQAGINNGRKFLCILRKRSTGQTATHTDICCQRQATVVGLGRTNNYHRRQ